MLTPWFVTGFCDGAAAFTYSKAGESFNLYFSIRQKEEMIRLVEDIQQFFDEAGTIYRGQGIAIGKKFKSSQRTFIYYRVARVDELSIIINHFDKYPLQSRKQEAYQIWREMALHKIEKYRDIDYNMLKVLSERLTGLNQKSKNPGCLVP